VRAVRRPYSAKCALHHCNSIAISPFAVFKALCGSRRTALDYQISLLQERYFELIVVIAIVAEEAITETIAEVKPNGRYSSGHVSLLAGGG
jgi:hypothetical protein